MRAIRLPATFLLLSLLLAFVSLSVDAKKDGKDAAEAEMTDDEATFGDWDTIEENPYFLQPEEYERDDYDDDSDQEDENEQFESSEANSTKAKIANALGVSEKKFNKYLTMAKNCRRQIIIALAVFAFRSEICSVLLHVVKNQIMDPKTGDLRVSATSLIKLFFFVDVMRRFQSGQNGSQPGFLVLAELGRSNPLMGFLLSRMFRFPVFNPAFIPPISQHYTFERVNERYVKDGMALHKAIHARHDEFKWPTMERAITQTMIAGSRLAKIPRSKETVIIVDMTGLSTSVANMEQIRDEVSFLLSQYRVTAMKVAAEPSATRRREVSRPPLEVVVLLESPGGSAADYGLAAQQLLRLRNEPGITLTICVDKVAASGGYMMACTASPGHLFAAPFAVVGSIGVIGQIVNANRLLEGWGLSPLVFRGGKDKAPLDMIGEITQEGKDKIQSMVDITHKAFQQHVVDARPLLKKHMKIVGTGDIFIGTGALEAGLIDKITTSDEYISAKTEEGARVLKLLKNRKAWFPFGTNYDNYDTTIEGRQPVSLSNILSGAWKSTSSYLGFGGVDAVSDSFRQAISLVQSPKLQTP